MTVATPGWTAWSTAVRLMGCRRGRWHRWCGSRLTLGFTRARAGWKERSPSAMRSPGSRIVRWFSPAPAIGRFSRIFAVRPGQTETLFKTPGSPPWPSSTAASGSPRIGISRGSRGCAGGPRFEVGSRAVGCQRLISVIYQLVAGDSCHSSAVCANNITEVSRKTLRDPSTRVLGTEIDSQGRFRQQ